jgi:hypothetical protein
MIMKKIILLIAIVAMLMMSPVMVLAGSESTATSNSGASAISAPVINSSPSAGASAVSSPVITTNPSATAGVVSAPTTNSDNNLGALAVVQSSPNYLQGQPIYPYLLQIIPGVVGDVTDREEMPKFANLLPLGKEDKVVKVIYYTRGGRIFGFSRLEDFDSDLLNLIPEAAKQLKQQDTSKIRFKVLFKMSSKTIGANLGAGGATAGFGGGVNPTAWGSNGAGIASFAVNTADPKFIIKFYLIQ